MELFQLCGFEVKPVDKQHYVKRVKELLADIPPTVTTKDVEKAEAVEGDEEVDGGDVGTTPLHRICEALDASAAEDSEQVATAHAMIDALFLRGANWMMLDDNNETAGCIALRRKLPRSIYDKFVSAGVRAEVFLRRMTEDADEEDEDEDEGEGDKNTTVAQGDTASNQAAYLGSKLTYEEDKLVTEEKKDGVMMDWETPIMEQSAELICPLKPETAVLNVGFGMGIIDKFLQERKPGKHYICEAHPDVLAKMRADGWHEKPGVVVLEGRWQDTLPTLLEQGVTLDGLYYDTFSEHYSDLVDFFDLVVGLMKEDGTFSFFNGLGADRQICYDVYCQVVEVDLQEYGMQTTYRSIPVDRTDSDKTWDAVRRQYWTLDEYKMPVIHFIGV